MQNTKLKKVSTVLMLAGILGFIGLWDMQTVLAGESGTVSEEMLVTGSGSLDSTEQVTGSAVVSVSGSSVNTSSSESKEEKDGKEIVIVGKLTPSVIEQEKDLAGVEMNKLTFSEDVSETPEKEEAAASGKETMERIYTLEVKGKGGLCLAVTQADWVSFENLTLQVYSDISMTKKIGKNYQIDPDTKVIDTKEYYLPAAGTYYLKFTYQGTKEKTFAMTAAFLYGTDRTLSEGKSLITYADAKKRTVYYKIQTKKDGLISFSALPENGQDLLTGHLLLCDKKKQPVSVSEYVSGSEDNNKAVHSYYAVKKGTYYLKAKLNNSYIASYNFTKTANKAGTGLASAAKLAVNGKEKKSVLYDTDALETEKWYRFRIKQSQNFTIVINSYVNGYLKAEVCNAAGTTVKSGTTNFYTGTKLLKTSSKWQSGIYYIRISKTAKSSKSSGYFSIAVKNN